MKFHNHNLLSLIIFSFLIIAGCNPSNEVAENLPNSEETALNQTIPESENNEDNSVVSEEGQVVEVGNYHLELVTFPENTGVHLDLYLQTGDNHETIPNADVVGDIQLPDGTEKQVTFTYDAQGEHYTADLSDTPSGQYQMKTTVQSEGEVVNGRFSFEL